MRAKYVKSCKENRWNRSLLSHKQRAARRHTAVRQVNSFTLTLHRARSTTHRYRPSAGASWLTRLFLTAVYLSLFSACISLSAACLCLDLCSVSTSDFSFTTPLKSTYPLTCQPNRPSIQQPIDQPKLPLPSSTNQTYLSLFEWQP